ncbi:hypothetical protein ACUR5C_03215 [Aliikangiella sp. IMCC44653]
MNLQSIKAHFRNMALTPITQLKRLAIGTLLSLIFSATLILFAEALTAWLFYSLALALILSALYALPGYFGIWLWRMRKFLFDLD